MGPGETAVTSWKVRLLRGCGRGGSFQVGKQLSSAEETQHSATAGQGLKALGFGSQNTGYKGRLNLHIKVQGNRASVW